MNAQARRAAHLERAGAIRKRKRLRRLRAEIHTAMAKADQRVAESATSASYRAPDIKDSEGWQIIDEHDQVVAHDTSRDKARAKARKLNSSPALTRDEAMLELGYERIGPDYVPGLNTWVNGEKISTRQATHVEERFRFIGIRSGPDTESIADGFGRGA